MNETLASTPKPKAPFVNVPSRFSGSSIKERFAGGAVWTLAGNLGWRLFSAIATISIARILGPRGFGELGMVRSTVQMFSVYAGFRLGNTATKYVAEYRLCDPLKAARILKLTLMISALLCGVVSLILLLSSRILAMGVLANETLTAAIAMGAFMLFFTIYGDVQAGALAGFENFKAIAKTNMLRGLMTPLVCIPLTYVMGIEGAIMGLTIVALIVAGLLRRHIVRAIRKAKFVETIQFVEAWRESSVLWQFALPGFLSGVITSVLLWAGRIILIRQDAGFTELGMFTAADQWRIMVLFIPAIIARVVLPIISSSIHSSGREMKESIGIQVHANGMIALPLTVLLIGFSEPLAAIFGKAYAGTELIIPMLMLSVYFTAVNQSVRVIYDGVGRRWLNLSMRILWGVVFLTSSLYYVPRAGAFGFATAHLISEIALFIVQTAVADLYLVRGALRRYTGLFGYSIVLLAAAYGTTWPMSPWLANVAGLGILLASCIPALITLQKQLR